MSEELTQTQPQSISDLEPKMCLPGVVKEIQLYGAIVDIGLERDGMVHISQIAPKRINRVTDVVNTGDDVTVWVTKVNLDKGRIELTMVEPPELEWQELSEERVYTGTVTRIEPYGAFVNIGAERDGLLHVREMSSGYVRHPSEIVQMGEQIEVRILKLDRQKRRIDLTMMGITDVIEDDPSEQQPTKTAMEIALERAQAQPQTHSRRQGKQRSAELTERESILARTLEKHSRH
jgi:small subunit ribosomal protein S1